MTSNPEKKGIAATLEAKAPPKITVPEPAPTNAAVIIPPAPVPEKKKAYVGTSREVVPLVPSDLDGAWRMAIIFATSGLLPKSYGTGETETMAAKAFLAMQLGAEVGLSPMQAIQSIAIVNGQPSIWGDAMLGLVRKSGLLSEYFEKVYKDGDKKNWKAVSRARRGEEVIETTFTWQDAVTAQLAGKSGTWQTHPSRMLLYKARAFTLRDLFSDVLKGLVHSAEEMEGEADFKGAKPALAAKTTSGFASRVETEGTVIDNVPEDETTSEDTPTEADVVTEEEPASAWDNTIKTLHHTSLHLKGADLAKDGVDTLLLLMGEEKTKAQRLELINLNLAFIRELASKKMMENIEEFHKLAGEGE